MKERDVSYCGKKDRYAETSQWLSIYLPKSDGPDIRHWAEKSDLDIDILKLTRGKKKLRRGQHKSNRFKIRLRNLMGDSKGLTEKLDLIRESGVPNYFGEQRFGRNLNNLRSASMWLDEGKKLASCGPKSMVMSAARSYLFNLYLSRRVEDDSWHVSIEGDVEDQAGFPTAPMWGRGRSARAGQAKSLELETLNGFETWLEGLEHCGLGQESRSMVLKAEQLAYNHEGTRLNLSFDLPPGQYATSLLRELVILKNKA